MAKFFRRAQHWLRGNQLDTELAEEMEFHQAMKERELTEAGVSQAASASRREMGNLTLAREEARAVWIWPWLESFWQDLAYGVRTLRRQPGFTLIALAALGIGIGLNTSLFTAFNGLALRPWPVKDPAHVVHIVHPIGSGTGGFSIAEYRYLAAHSRLFSGVIAMRECGAVKLEGQDSSCFYVSGNYFGVLGIDMRLGRGFLPEEDRAGAPQAVAVISHAVWQGRFGGDPDLVGKRIHLDDVPFIVVGVASKEFTGTPVGRGDLWIPLPSMALLRPNEPMVKPFLTAPDFCCSSMAGRLAPGASREQARAEAELLLEQFRSQFRMDRITLALRDTSWAANAGSKARKAVPIVMLMFLAVTLVLLLACANVGNLLLARASARRQEIALRLSLGGSRRRLIRQLLVESFTLALAGSGIGLAIACVLPSFVASRLAHSASLRLMPDWYVLAYTIALAVLACAAFGLAPALHATRGSIAGALKGETRLVGVRLSLRGMLLAVQVAISVMLLAGAGLLVRGIQRAQAQDPGFAVDGVQVVSLDLPATAYGGPRTAAFARQLRLQLEGSPEMPDMGFCVIAPLSNANNMTGFRFPGEDETKNRIIVFHEVSAGYFDVLRIPVLAGRNIEPKDADRPVALINETMARRYWPGESPVGKTVISRIPRQIVGVVRDAYTQVLGSVEPMMYFPIAGGSVPRILVRGGGPAAVKSIAAVAKQLEPRVQVRAAPLAENFRNALEPGLVGAMLAGTLGVVALLLASIGVSGVFAYVVRQRTREIAIRMALGAQPLDVMRLVLGSSSRALLAGMTLGYAGVAAISRLLAHDFYGVSAFDPAAYAFVVVLLAVAGAGASMTPVRRAIRVDPMTALRWE